MIKWNPDVHHRKSIRLKNYDYSQEGLYFITICVHDRSPLFGKIHQHVMFLNPAGTMVAYQWLQLLYRFPSIALHEYVIMPNHFHGIIEILNNSAKVIPCTIPNRHSLHSHNSAQNKTSMKPPPTIGNVIGAFKSLSTKEYIKNVKQNDWQPFVGRLWQRNYYEHIISNETSYLKIAEYIETNPLCWEKDTYHV